MSYRSELYKKALEELEDRRSKAVLEQAENRSLAFSKIPELEALSREISSVGTKLYRIYESRENVAQRVEELSRENMKQNERFERLLTENGFAPDFLELKYFCPKCRDTGFVNGEQCECLKALVKKEASLRLNFTSPVTLSDFDSFRLSYYDEKPDPKTGVSPLSRMKAIFEYCRDWANYFSRSSKSILMQGKTGLGKTHLSLAIARCVIEQGYDVVYGSVFNLMSRIEQEHFGKKENEDSYEHLLNCDLLILDDLGTEFSSGFTKKAIYSIINTRLLAQLPTIISTNLSMEEMLETYSDRVVSRLLNGYDRLVFLGRDIRFEKRKKQ
ncbi:MAG: ATP-binding protein [Clostridia bacterium]|nr:ATP-binding protein [Clostridia bacterium]